MKIFHDLSVTESQNHAGVLSTLHVHKLFLEVRPERFRSWPLSRSRQEAGRSKAIGYEPVLSHRVVFFLAYLDIENSMISSARPK